MFNKITQLTKSFLILTLLSLLLVAIRVFKTSDLFGLGLAWNLFLAGIPVVFALLARRLADKKKIILSLFFMLLWLLFYPNSAYIITDLIHLDHLPEKIWWFDSMLIFQIAFTGLLLGLYSVYIIHEFLLRFFNNYISWFLMISAILLSGFGIYLGRFLRFNSWDFFTSPFSLSVKIFEELKNPLAIQMTCLFGIIQFFIYISLRILKNTNPGEI